MIRVASHKDIPELKRLFTICFGDTDEFLNLFFTEYFKTTTGMVTIRDGRIAAMLFLCPASMKVNGGRQPVYYVYACGTLPEYRRQGLMDQLLQVACAYSKQQGAWGLILVPASDELVCYYGKLGFEPFSCYEEQRMTPLAFDEELLLLEACELSAQQIATIRNKQFNAEFQVRWNRKHVAFSIALLQQQGGGSLGIRWKNGRTDYVLYEKGRGVLSVKETTAEESVYALLTPFLCRHFNVSAVNYFTPVRQGEILSMAKPCGTCAPGEDDNPYFNLDMG